MAMNAKKKKTMNKTGMKDQGLVDVVFSWSIGDVLNRDLYKGKVVEIPKTFASTSQYMSSFVYPLLEETHADLLSHILEVNRAPTIEIFRVVKSKDFQLPKELAYNILLKKGQGLYEPEVGDLIALTDAKPKSVDDLDRQNKPYLIALVQKMKDKSQWLYKLKVLSSKPIFFHNRKENAPDNGKTFAVFLTNLTTNIRIWQALHSEVEENKKIIKNVQQVNSSVGETCAQCSSNDIRGNPLLKMREMFKRFELDNAQKSAVISCVTARECCHQNTVKLIWGPPGTGKTKTVGSLLFMLLKMKCRTLTCAPTNVAVLEVTTRLVSSVRDSLRLQYDTYGLGDIVLFGNGERMKIDDREDLHDVFLNFRVKILADCLAPLSGWKGSANWIINLLQNPEEQYSLYLEKEKQKDDDEEEGESDNDDDSNKEVNNVEKGSLYKEKENESSKQDLKEARMKKIWKTLIVKTLKENKKGKKKKRKNNRNKNEEEQKTGDKVLPKERSDEKKFQENLWTFEEFVLKGYDFLGNRLISCIKNLYTHMPTSFISAKVAAQMVLLVGYLEILGDSLKKIVAAKEGLREAFNQSDGAREYSKRCLRILKSLQATLCFPQFREDLEIRNFCLGNACLIFCTASGSIKLHTEGMTPLELVVIDEAAQLKECESTIPLQLSGVRHAILVGDERQLPAMVQSKISGKAEFGRSLFERLVSLGHKKHLLNVQYRMHPSISLFPNREFYEKKVLDGANVKESTYGKHILQGSIYGSYAFINVSFAMEEFDNSHSRKNVVEVAVVAEIVARLFKESIARKQKVSVGCISPYKAQVNAIQEKLGDKYKKGAESYFSVNVRSVDGFQGGEEDVIIVSTVRCNEKGSVGFLSNRQRTNVALTRARYCLWILGNGATLTNSGSVWRKLVVDAKKRGCFFDASEDKSLCLAIMDAQVELGLLETMLRMDSLLFKDAKWEVTFSDMFFEKIVRLTNLEIRKEIVSLLMRLSSGWRQPQKSGSNIVNKGGACQILERYNVSGDMYLIWAVDVVNSGSKCFQVLKIWDILPASKIKKLAKKLDSIYGNYTTQMMNRCKAKHLGGALVLPMTWPMNSDTDPSSSLANQLAALTLRNQQRLP